jgi:hypothetical protein
LTPSKAAAVSAAFPESLAGAARAGVVAADLLDEFLVAVDDPLAALHLGLAREALAPLTHHLESRLRR